MTNTLGAELGKYGYGGVPGKPRCVRRRGRASRLRGVVARLLARRRTAACRRVAGSHHHAADRDGHRQCVEGPGRRRRSAFTRIESVHPGRFVSESGSAIPRPPPSTAARMPPSSSTSTSSTRSAYPRSVVLAALGPKVLTLAATRTVARTLPHHPRAHRDAARSLAISAARPGTEDRHHRHRQPTDDSRAIARPRYKPVPQPRQLPPQPNAVGLDRSRPRQRRQ